MPPQTPTLLILQAGFLLQAGFRRQLKGGPDEIVRQAKLVKIEELDPVLRRLELRQLLLLLRQLLLD